MIQLIIIILFSFIGLFVTYRILNTKWKETTCSNEVSENLYLGITRDIKKIYNDDVFKFGEAKVTLIAKTLLFIIFIAVNYFFTPFFIWLLVSAYMIFTSSTNKLAVSNARKIIPDPSYDIVSLVLYGRRIIYYYQIFLTVLFYLYIIIR